MKGFVIVMASVLTALAQGIDNLDFSNLKSPDSIKQLLKLVIATLAAGFVTYRAYLSVPPEVAASKVENDVGAS